jgi:hypothetical protein
MLDKAPQIIHQRIPGRRNDWASVRADRLRRFPDAYTSITPGSSKH